jgi:hypothetical protein
MHTAARITVTIGTEEPEQVKRTCVIVATDSGVLIAFASVWAAILSPVFDNMKSTKKLTLSSVTVALGVALMMIGAVFEPLDLASACISSVLVAFIYIEIGAPYTWLVWIATSLITAIVYPASGMWVMYLFLFGLYPMVKGYIERAPRTLWWILKIAFYMISASALGCTLSFLLGIPLIEGEFFGLKREILLALLYAFGALAFVMYDVFLTAGVKVYYMKLRPKIKNILK